MKKIAFMLIFPALVAVGCSSDDELAPSVSPYIIDVEAEELQPTRTSLSEDGQSIFWDADDSLSVFLGGDIMSYAVIYGEPQGRSAKFIVDGKFVIGGTVDD